MNLTDLIGFVELDNACRVFVFYGDPDTELCQLCGKLRADHRQGEPKTHKHRPGVADAACPHFPGCPA